MYPIPSRQCPHNIWIEPIRNLPLQKRKDEKAVPSIHFCKNNVFAWIKKISMYNITGINKYYSRHSHYYILQSSWLSHVFFCFFATTNYPTTNNDEPVLYNTTTCLYVWLCVYIAATFTDFVVSYQCKQRTTFHFSCEYHPRRFFFRSSRCNGDFYNSIVYFHESTTLITI